MTPAATTSPQTRRLTMPEIEVLYDGQWVLLDEVETDEMCVPVSGRLLFHHPERDEVDRVMMEVDATSIARFYVGRPPEGVAFLL